MKKFTTTLLIAVIAISCGQKNKTENQNAVESNLNFSGYKERLVLRFWEMYPTWASAIGYHNFDSILNIPDESQEKKERNFIDRKSVV